MFNAKRRPPSDRGPCVTCGKPRATVPYGNPKMKMFIHAACQQGEPAMTTTTKTLETIEAALKKEPT